MLERPLAFRILVGLWVVLVVLLLPVREVIPPDEPRFTQQAQEMRDAGDPFVPTIGGLPNADKPPMLFWAIQAASLPLSRIHEGTARIPSAIAALVVLLLTARLGRRLFGSEAVGFGGALVLLTGVEFFQKAQWVSCDMILAAWSWAALTIWREAIFEGHGGRARVLLGWGAVAGAILSKGPVGLLWPAFWVVAEATARRRFRPVLRLLRPEGPLLAVGLVGVWLVGFGMRAGWSFVEEAVLRQNLNRYVSAWNSVAPWYFYFGQLPVDFLPWTFLLPAGAALALLKWSQSEPAGDGIAVRSASLFLAFGFAFFSGSSGKRGVYLLPSFPVLALLFAAAFLGAGGPGGVRGWWRTAGLTAMAAVGAILGIAAPVAIAAGALRRAPEIASEIGALEIGGLVVAGAALAAGAIVAIRLSRRGRAADALVAAVMGVAVLLLSAGTVGGAAWSRHQGGRAYGQRVASLVPRQNRIAIERGKFELVLFYAERLGVEIETDERLAEELSSGRCEYAILKEPRYRALRDLPPVRDMELLDVTRVGGQRFHLLGPPRP